MTKVSKKLAVLSIISLFSATFLTPQIVSAEEFNPHFVIGDTTIRDYQSMGYADILLFLSKKGGLHQVKDIDPVDGQPKDAARLIFDIANRYQINPKYLLALIQKESSAVETVSPTVRQLSWATGYAVCDSCKTTDMAIQKHKGFAKQVDSAADWMDWYLTGGPGGAYVQPHTTSSIDNTAVTPVNMTTAALYAYTPHIHGNRLLWSIWNRWFGAGADSFNYPDGTLLRNAKSGGVAVMKDGELRPIMSRSVLFSLYNTRNIVSINEYYFDALMEDLRGEPIRFPDNSLVRTETGRTYLLIGNRKRLITSSEVFISLGFNPEEVEDATDEELSGYANGEPISLASAPPSGTLRRDVSTGRIWYVEGDEKRRIFDPGVILANFPYRPVEPATAEELSVFKEGPPMNLLDGALVKKEGDPTVYVITSGKKRPITDEASFLAFGYRWDNIVTVGAGTISLHETDEALSF